MFSPSSLPICGNLESRFLIVSLVQQLKEPLYKINLLLEWWCMTKYIVMVWNT